MDPFDPETNLAELERQLERVGELLALPEERLRAKVPEVSGWSAGEHAYHLLLACDLSLRNAASLAKDSGMLVREPEQRSDEALAILREGVIPRGVAPAPRFVTPPPRVDFDLARQLLDEIGLARSSLAADLAALRAAPRAVPHQLLGDLTGPEWVRFARVHTGHHLLILDEVLTELGRRGSP